MTDTQTPALAEATPDQRAAWLGITLAFPESAKLLAPLLPSELTDPRPALPTEPGHYLDKDGDAWRVYPDGVWLALWSVDPEERQDTSPEDYGPFTRLVPERPQITREQVGPILREWHAGLIADGEAADQLAALLNGADE